MYRFLHLASTLLILILFAGSIHSQVVAPTFQCVKGDTLFWVNNNNTCGAFVSTDIYFASDEAGPYALLTSISDPAETQFFHSNNAGLTYYYLQHNYNCGGMTLLSSDTLDNLTPGVTQIERVSVQGNNVHITWYPNPDPETIGYIIYRSTNQGTTPIDTVYGVFEYLDVTADPNNQIEVYYVIAIDACGNTGTFDSNPHNTMLLNAEVNFCEQYVRLSWNSYGLWENGIDNNQVWLGLDGADLAYEHLLSMNDTMLFITRINDGLEYCFQVRSEEQGRDVTSFSNTICLTADVINPLTRLNIRNVNVLTDNSIEVDWDYNADADLTDLILERSMDTMSFGEIQSLIPQPSTDNNSTTDNNVVPENEIYYYRLNATDDCDTSTTSNIFSSVNLQVTASSPTQNTLSWTPIYVPGRRVIGYDICLLVDGAEELLGNVDENTLQYGALVDFDRTGGQYCYVIKAIHVNGQGLDTLASRSNIDCTQQIAEMYVPNAFAPSGIRNPIFEPRFANDLNVPYQMNIYNRWGGHVFSNEGVNIGWDGRIDGGMANPGVYMYTISFTQPSGENQRVSGTVTLIR